MKTPSSSLLLDWAVADKALPGESVSGDLHLVQPHSQGCLLAVVDGIGHGPEATHAAVTAVEALRQRPEDSVHSLLQRCHLALAHTRGVVMTVVAYNSHDGTITLCGVGNVDARLFRTEALTGAPPNESVLLRGGTVGAQLPVLYASVIPVYAGDVLIMASDGLRNDYGADLGLKSPPQRIADQILRRYWKGTDDALVLVTRFRDSTHES